MDPGFPVRLLGFQFGSWVSWVVFQDRSWNTSLDTEIPVWILGLQCEYLDSSVDPGIMCPGFPAPRF